MAYTTINKPNEYFNTVTYAGNSSSTQSITGVNFQPDFVWIKQRNLAYSHILFDAIRGVGKSLQSNAPAVEETNSSIGYLSAFDSDGFTVSQGSSGGDRVNGAYNYVSWNWEANGAGVSNTDGSITSTVSANPTSGFSVVTYTGTNAIASVGHGLGVKPAMIIAKNLTTAGEDWAVYHKSLGGYQYYLKLNSDTAVLTATNRWNAEPDTNVFNVGAVGETNGSGTSQVAYVFVEKKGYSKFGSYTGNGNADGTFVYTGFKPAFVLIKRSASTAAGWCIFDNKRDGYNPNKLLLANNTNVESSPNFDIVSNGFKTRTADGEWNGSGSTYIYMAFAENPLVGTNGVPATAR
jgi:hypothetical protein